MKKIFISCFLAIIHNIIFCQTELQETRKANTALTPPNQIQNNYRYLSDSINRSVEIITNSNTYWLPEYTANEDNKTLVVELTKKLDSINTLPIDATDESLKLLIDSLNKEISNLNVTIKNKDQAIGLEIMKTLLFHVEGTLTKYKAIIASENLNIEKLLASADSFYNPLAYQSFYHMDTLSVSLLSKTRSAEKSKLDAYKLNITSYQTTLISLELLYNNSNNNFKKNNIISEDDKKSIKKHQLALDSIALEIKENVDYVDSLRINVINLISTRKKISAYEPTNKEYSSLINIITPITSARLLPQLTLSGNLFMPSTEYQERKLDLSIFATVPPAYETDTNKISSILNSALGSIFIAEQSTLGIKLSYVLKRNISLYQNTRINNNYNETNSAIGFKGSVYYLSKKLPILNDTSGISSATNVGFLQIKSGIGLTFYNNILQIYLNGNYLQPLDNVANYETLVKSENKGYFYSDAGISALLVTDSKNPLTTKLNLNCILVNGDISGIMKTPDRVLTTIGLGIGIK